MEFVLTGRRLGLIAGVLAIPLLLAAGCRRESGGPAPATEPAPSPVASAGKIGVFVCILPHADFVRHVAGDLAAVDVLVGPGQNPHNYEPTPGQMSSLAKARVFFRTGMPFEETLVPKIQATFKQLQIVDLRQGITLRHVEAHEREPEHAGEGAHDAHYEDGGDDPHIWLAPKLAKIQAATICDTFCRLDPDHADAYRKNLAAFQRDLDALDQRLADALAPVKGGEFLVFHPAFGYFADAYGLKQVPVEIEGKEPSARDMAALIQRARSSGTRVIFVQPQFSTRAADTIAEQIGGAVVPLDDLPRDYIASLDVMAKQVKQALSHP